MADEDGLPANHISLRTFVERIFDEREKQYLQSFQVLRGSTSDALAAHRETHIAEIRSVDIAREELNHWKTDHNNLQKQMKDDAAEYVKSSTYQNGHKDLSDKIEGVRRLVYMGVGLCIGLNFAVGIFITLWVKLH